ncbi:MAG: TIGR00730 family Rossman fold protein [Vicinamibacterales bacterium]
MGLGRVCVFCGSSSGESPVYREAAERLATTLVSRRIDLVFGGGCVGLMGIVADTVLKGGGHVIGVIPDALVAREVAHLGLPDLRVVPSMHERKAVMASLADAFIALPGGFGTFEELFEALTWTQLGLHAKRCGLLNVAGFYDPLLALLDQSVAAGFLKPANRRLLDAATDPETLLDALAQPPPPAEGKWIRTAAEA